MYIYLDQGTNILYCSCVFLGLPLKLPVLGICCCAFPLQTSHSGNCMSEEVPNSRRIDVHAYYDAWRIYQLNNILFCNASISNKA